MANISNWKDLERITAKILGGKRNWRGGNFSVSDSDVSHPIFEIECKKRKTIQPFNRESLKSLTEASLYSRRGKNKKVPLGVCQTPTKPLKLCYLYLTDFIKLINEKKIEAAKIPIAISLDNLGGLLNGNIRRFKKLQNRRRTKKEKK